MDHSKIGLQTSTKCCKLIDQNKKKKVSEAEADHPTSSTKASRGGGELG